MSRLQKFTRSLVSGYLMLGANSFYSLASVPLALHYLGTVEFGLWALISQISGYIALVDLGMTGSVARILIDHKDDRANGAYGGVIKTGMLVGLVQAALVLLAGTALSLCAGAVLPRATPAELRHVFLWLMIGQSGVLAVSFAMRIFSTVLYAHQRVDVFNNTASVFFFFNLAAMWAGFAAGWGLYGFLAGQAVMALGTVSVNAAACVRLGLLPHGREWGRATVARFRELFSFGNDIFLLNLGGQLINASQTILLTRLLGLEAAAVWTVGTRAYQVVMIVLNRVFDYSVPVLSEMMVRGERDRLSRRFQQIVIFSIGPGLAAGGIYALCNSAFVTVWTHGRIAWQPVNDLLLACWLVACLGVRLHTGLASQTKQFRFLRYIFFLEGTVFIGLAVAVCRFGGITAMLMASILCTLCFSLPYGLYRTRQYFELSARELWAWHRPALRLVFWLVPAGILMWWLGRDGSTILRLVLGGGVFGLWAGWAWLRHGLTPELQTEMVARLPGWGKIILLAIFRKPKAANNPTGQ